MSTASGMDLPTFVDVVRPKEHGSWSLVLEPVVLALIVAPSGAGAAGAAAVLALFFARRPLRMVATERQPARRRVAVRATIACAAVATVATAAAVLSGGFVWLPWLLPTAVGGTAFLYFDLRRAGREQAAEIAGSFAFAVLPAAFARAAGLPAATAIALAAVMLARSLPTVLVVRATVRARKNTTRPSVLPFVVALLALAMVAALVRDGEAPAMAVAAALALAVRAFVLVVAPRPSLRASTIGMIEAILGAVYVLAIGLAW